METKWTDKIEQGMKLIIEGCKENPNWFDCWSCPFHIPCVSICEDTNISTPKNWEKMALILQRKDK